MAVKTVSNAGGNWNSAATWSPSGVPSTTADNVVFTSTSGPLTISATATIENINFSNYQNTVTFNWPLQVTGAFNLGTESYTMSFDSTLDASGRPRGRIRHTDTATITTNNRPWQTPWQFYGTTETVTLSGNLILEQNFYLSHTGTLTLSGGSIVTKKNVIADSTAGITTGAATFSMEPINSATWSSTGGSIRNNLLLNPATGSYLFLGDDVYYGGRKLTTINNRIGQTNSVLHIESSCTLDTSNIYWNNILIDNASVTLNLASDLYIKRNLKIANNTISFTGNPTYSIKFEDENSDIVGDVWIYPTSVAISITLPYNFTVRDAIIGGGGYNTAINSNNIYINRNLIFLSPNWDLTQTTSTITSGTTVFNLIGTGCLISLPTNTGGSGDPTDLYPVVRNNIIINTTGTIFFGQLLYQTGTFQITSGNFQHGATFSNNTSDNPSSPLVDAITSWFPFQNVFYFFSAIIVNNTAAVVPDIEWVKYQIGHRYQDPASIVRTLTSDIICKSLVIGPVGTVTINGPGKKIYTHFGFIVGNEWSSYGGATTITVGGNSGIYVGLSGSVSTANASIGTHIYQAFDSFFDFAGINPATTAKVSLPVTINTTGTVSISSFVTGDTSTGIYAYDNLFRFGGSTFSVENAKFNLDNSAVYIDSSSSIILNTSSTFSNIYIYATGSTPNSVRFSSNEPKITINEITLSPHQTYTTTTIGGQTYTLSVNTAYIDLYTGYYTQSIYCKKVTLPNPGLIYIYNGNSGGETIITEELEFNSSQFNSAGDTNVSGNFSVTSTFSFNSDSSLNVGIWLNNANWYQVPGKVGTKSGITWTGGSEIGGTEVINENSTVKLIGDIYNYDEIRHYGGQLDTSDCTNYYMYGSGIWNLSTQNFTSSPNLTFSNLHIIGSILDRYFWIDESLYINNLYIGNSDYYLQNNGTGSLIVDNFYFSTQSQKLSIQSPRWEVFVNDYIGSTYSLNNNIDRVILTSTFSTGLATASRYLKFTVSQNATQDLHFVDAIYIDSSEGATVWTYKGNITNSYNWNQLPTQPRTISYSSSS